MTEGPRSPKISMEAYVKFHTDRSRIAAVIHEKAISDDHHWHNNAEAELLCIQLQAYTRVANRNRWFLLTAKQI